VRQRRWTGLVFVLKELVRITMVIASWEAMYSLEKREQSFFKDDICSCFVDFSVTGKQLKRWRLFHLM